MSYVVFMCAGMNKAEIELAMLRSGTSAAVSTSHSRPTSAAGLHLTHSAAVNSKSYRWPQSCTIAALYTHPPDSYKKLQRNCLTSQKVTIVFTYLNIADPVGYLDVCGMQRNMLLFLLLFVDSLTIIVNILLHSLAV